MPSATVLAPISIQFLATYLFRHRAQPLGLLDPFAHVRAGSIFEGVHRTGIGANGALLTREKVLPFSAVHRRYSISLESAYRYR